MLDMWRTTFTHIIPQGSMKLKPLAQFSVTIGALAVGGFVTLGIIGSFLPERPETQATEDRQPKPKTKPSKAPDALTVEWADQDPKWDPLNPDRTFSLPSLAKAKVTYRDADGAVGYYVHPDRPNNPKAFRSDITITGEIEDGDFVRGSGYFGFGGGWSGDKIKAPVAMIGYNPMLTGERPGEIRMDTVIQVEGIFSDVENEEGMPESLVGSFFLPFNGGAFVGTFYAEHTKTSLQ